MWRTVPRRAYTAGKQLNVSTKARMAASTSGRPTSGTAHDGGRIHPGPLAGLGTPNNLSVEEPGYDHAEEAVQQGEEQERNHQTRHRRYRVSGAKHALDNPGLTPNLRDCPSGLDRNE